MAIGSLRQQLAVLYQLQEHDRELLSMHQRSQVIPQEIKQLEESVTKFKTEMTARSDELAEVEKSLRSKNADLEMNDVQREKYKSEQRTVTTNEQYTALDNQIEFLDQKDLETEEEILELMEESDRLKEKLTELEAEVARENEKTTGEKLEYQEEQKSLKKSIDEKTKQRSQYLPKISQELSRLYHNWVNRRKSDFLSLGKNGTCGSCRLTIQPQNLKEAQKYEKLVFCTSCKRLLYVEPLSLDIPYP